MKPRLMILIGLAGAMAIYLATATNKTPAELETGPGKAGDDRRLTDAQREELITELGKMPLPGREPQDPPDLTATVAVDTSTGKNRLTFTISETHGYYVESLWLRIWYKDSPETDYQDSPLSLEHFMDTYLRANQTLRDCIEVVPAELKGVGGEIGTTDNWGVEVARYGRAREKDPEVLRYRPNDRRCD